MIELSSIDWIAVLQRLKSFATSEIAREQLDEVKPLSSADSAKDSFNEIIQAQNVIAIGQRPFMESLDLFNTWYPRLEKDAVLTTLELKDVRHFCIEAIALKEILKQADTEWGKNLRKEVMKAEEDLSAIDQIITTDGHIRTDASEKLYNLNNEKNQQVKHIQKILDKTVKDFDLENIIQDRFVTNREGRWVLPIKSGMQNQFAGIIHASSQSKQTVFMEPQEVIPINNRLREIEVEIEEEIERLLTELSNYLAGRKREFFKSQSILLKCDVLFSKAQLSDQLEACTCSFSDEEITLVDLRNPLLALNNEPVISNNVHLTDKKRILILSGPNAGGKTVLLKSVGLAAQMARCGLPICAGPGSSIPFFNELHVGVGDSQSVDENLSTFAAHLKILGEAANAKGGDKLLLIDEICGSTDPEEGSALARSFIKRYDENGVFAVITSHLGALKKGWEENGGIVNGSLEFNKEKGPTYQFLMGVPGQSLAIQTAKRVGVSDDIVDQAMEFLSPEHRKYQENLKEVERIREELGKIRAELSSKRDKYESEKKNYEKMQKEFQKEKSTILEKVTQEAEKEMERLIEKAKVEATFKKHQDIQKMKADLPKIVKAPNQGEGDQSFKIESADEFTKRYPPGSKVFAVSLNQDAVVQGKANNKGEIPILSNSMRMVLPWTDLRPPQKSANPTQEVLRRSKHYSVNPADGDRVVDVRGLKIDEATNQLEIQLDTAALNSEDRVKVIHGHGTESLKRSIRSYLSRSVYVKRWSAGTPDSGGDGITWIELKD